MLQDLPNFRMARYRQRLKVPCPGLLFVRKTSPYSHRVVLILSKADIRCTSKLFRMSPVAHMIKDQASTGLRCAAI